MRVGSVVVFGCLFSALVVAGEHGQDAALDLMAGRVQGEAFDMAARRVHAIKSPEHAIDFWYYIPEVASTNGALPLVLAYHGASERGLTAMKRWRASADKHGFIVVCPTSKCAGAYVKPAASLKLTRGDYQLELEAAVSVIDTLAAGERVDRRHLMVTGFSGGGNPAYHHAFVRPDLFGCVAIRSGNFPGAWLLGDATSPIVARASKKSSILVLWGKRDHPIILEAGPQAVAWIRSIKVRDFEHQIIPRAGHLPQVERTAAWFARQLTKGAE